MRVFLRITPFTHMSRQGFYIKQNRLFVGGGAVCVPRVLMFEEQARQKRKERVIKNRLFIQTPFLDDAMSILYVLKILNNANNCLCLQKMVP